MESPCTMNTFNKSYPMLGTPNNVTMGLRNPMLLPGIMSTGPPNMLMPQNFPVPYEHQPASLRPEFEESTEGVKLAHTYNLDSDYMDCCEHVKTGTLLFHIYDEGYDKTGLVPMSTGVIPCPQVVTLSVLNRELAKPRSPHDILYVNNHISARFVCYRLKPWNTPYSLCLIIDIC